MSDAKKKISFDSAFKLKVVEYAETNTNRGAARKYGIDEKQVRQWRLKKDELKELPRTKRRLDSRGRKARLPDMETVLVDWIDDLRSENLRITLQCYAEEGH